MPLQSEDKRIKMRREIEALEDLKNYFNKCIDTKNYPQEQETIKIRDLLNKLAISFQHHYDEINKPRVPSFEQPKEERYVSPSTPSTPKPYMPRQQYERTWWDGLTRRNKIILGILIILAVYVIYNIMTNGKLPFLS